MKRKTSTILVWSKYDSIVLEYEQVNETNKIQIIFSLVAVLRFIHKCISIMFFMVTCQQQSTSQRVLVGVTLGVPSICHYRNVKHCGTIYNLGPIWTIELIMIKFSTIILAKL